MTNNQELYKQMQSGGPVIAQQGYNATVYVVGYEEARQVLGDNKRFVNDYSNTLPPDQRASRGANIGSLLYDNMLGTDYDDHKRLRALVSKAFTNRHIQALEPRIREIAEQLVNDFLDTGEVDLVEAYAFPLPIIVICELLGVPVEDRDNFRRWSHAFIGIRDEEAYNGQPLAEFVEYIAQMISARRANPRDDLISGLVHAEEDGQRLSEQELFSMIALLIVAGHETTVGLIANGMLALLQHPDQAALLRRDPELIDNAIEEFLRYDGPVEMAVTRYAAEDCEVGGVLIKRGTPVLVILAAADRDPEIFEAADSLDVTRQSNKHMGFGYGVHYCVGAPLARLEARIAFDTLLKHIPNLQLSVPAVQLKYTDSPVVHGLVRLPVEWR